MRLKVRGRTGGAGGADAATLERLDKVVDAAEGPACAVNARGTIVAANRAFDELLGLDAGDPSARLLSAIADGSTGKPFHREVLRALFVDGWERHRVSGRCIRPQSGEAVWGEWDFSLVRDTKGRADLALAFVSDVTEARRSDRHVRILEYLISTASRAEDANALLRDAVQVICHFTGCGLGQVWVPEGDVLVASPTCFSQQAGAERLRRASLGYRYHRGEGVPGRAWTSEGAVVERVQSDEGFDREFAASRAGAHTVMAVPVRSSTGVAVVIELFVTTDRADSSRQDLVETVASELGELLERRTLHDQVRLSEERFRSVAHSAADAIVSADREGRLLTWNQGAERIFGWRADEVIGQPLTVIIPERFRAAHRAGIERVVTTGESKLAGQILELAAVRKDGTELPIELAIGTWETAEGRFFSGVIRDITERKRAEEALAQAAREVERTNSELETLIYAASHDLKSPMISVLGYLDYLKVDYGEVLGEEGGRYLERMTDCTLYMQRLIHDLIKLSRVGRVDEDPVEVDFEDLVATIVDEILPAHPDARFYASSLPSLLGDPVAYRQLMTNLLENAAQHGGRADLTVVVTATALEGGGVEISVRDNGRGVPVEYRELVFGVFERLDNASEAGRAGTGMGLAICRKIVEQVGGTIAIVGNGGTDVRVTLPPERVGRWRPEHAEAPEPSQPAMANGAERGDR